MMFPRIRLSIEWISFRYPLRMRRCWMQNCAGSYLPSSSLDDDGMEHKRFDLISGEIL